MVEKLTLWSPHKLLKNLGAFSEYAKCSQNSTKIKKMKSYSLSWIRWKNGQKPSHATVPLNTATVHQGPDSERHSISDRTVNTGALLIAQIHGYLLGLKSNHSGSSKNLNFLAIISTILIINLH